MISMLDCQDPTCDGIRRSSLLAACHSCRFEVQDPNTATSPEPVWAYRGVIDSERGDDDGV